MDCLAKEIELLEQESQQLKAKILDQKTRYRTLRDLYRKAISTLNGQGDENLPPLRRYLVPREKNMSKINLL